MNELFNTLVYDRSSTDVDYRNELHTKMANGTATATEIATWNADNLKGAYNYTDFNRIGNALNLVKTLSEEIGRTCEYPYTVVTTYTRASLPDKDTDIPHLLANVQKAKEVYQGLITATVPSSIKTVENANVIEKILYDIAVIIDGTTVAYQYADSNLYAGG